MRLQDAKSCFEDNLTPGVPAGCNDLEEAARLLYEVLNESTRYAYNALEIDDNGALKDIPTLYSECVALMRQAATGGEKTAFLSMSILEETFRKTRPLCLTRLEDLLNGTSHMIENAKRLQELFDSNPYQAQWEARAGEYKRLMEIAGLNPGDANFSDLSALTDPLLNALNFYTGSKAHIYRIYSGKAAPGNPAVSMHVSMFRSESQAVDAIMGCGKDNAIMFAGVEPTYGDTEDYFGSWFSGIDPERMRNIMRNQNLTKEEYLKSIDPYARKVYLCVKSGGSLWLVHMPYAKESYSGGEFSEDTKFCYGKRAGYAPYQVFYKELPFKQEVSQFLTTLRPGWKLSDLMDSDQKAWLPVFLQETIDLFFKHPENVNAVDMSLPEARALVASADDGSSKELVATTGRDISLVTLRKEIPDPASLFEEEFMGQLIRYFNITPAALIKYAGPILSGPAMANFDVDSRLRNATLKLVADKLVTTLAQTGAARDMIQKALEDKEAIIERIRSGVCDGFTTLTINGRTLLNGVTEHTSMMDTKLGADYGDAVFWEGPVTRGVPPVVYQVRPKTGEDYAAILGISVEDLPAPLNIYGLAYDFIETFNHWLPWSLVRAGVLKPRWLMRVNLCMNKATFKLLNKNYPPKKIGARS